MGRLTRMLVKVREAQECRDNLFTFSLHARLEMDAVMQRFVATQLQKMGVGHPIADRDGTANTFDKSSCAHASAISSSSARGSGLEISDRRNEYRCCSETARHRP